MSTTNWDRRGSTNSYQSVVDSVGIRVEGEYSNPVSIERWVRQASVLSSNYSTFNSEDIFNSVLDEMDPGIQDNDTPINSIKFVNDEIVFAHNFKSQLDINNNLFTES